MTTEANKTLFRRFFEEVNLDNLAVLDEIMAADYVHHDPALSPEMQRGRDNYRQGVITFYTAFPDLHCTIEDMMAEGDRVVCRLTWQGTHQAALMGIPPTGKQINCTMQSLGRVVDGKLAECWVNFDGMGMLQQLGAIPAVEIAGG